MTVEVELINAISRDSEDDTVRMVYADWLTENGDPDRAELIRLQCSLERGIDFMSGNAADGERLEELRARERELIKTMLAPREAGEQQGIREFTTTPEIAAIVTDDHSRVSFKRGMIEHLDLYNTSIAALPPGLHVGGHFHLSRSLITALPPGLYVGGDLYFADTAVTELPPGLHVGGTLDLSNTPITELPPCLHVGVNLYLTGTNFTPEAAQSILTMPNLSVEAKVSGLQTAGFPALAFIARQNANSGSEPNTPPRP